MTVGQASTSSTTVLLLATLSPVSDTLEAEECYCPREARLLLLSLLITNDVEATVILFDGSGLLTLAYCFSIPAVGWDGVGWGMLAHLHVKKNVFVLPRTSVCVNDRITTHKLQTCRCCMRFYRKEE